MSHIQTSKEAQREIECGLWHWRDMVSYYAARKRGHAGSAWPGHAEIASDADVRCKLAASVVTAIETYAHYADAQNAERERRYAAQAATRQTHGAQL